MVDKLARLSQDTQDALAQFACLGNAAEVATLGIILECSADAVHVLLREAEQAGLVYRQEDIYTFLHDRMQEAAYSLIPEKARAGMHLRLGRLLASGLPSEAIAERIFEVVNQLNRGSELVESQEERERIAELNLLAGQRAKTTTAYTSALAYLAAGTALLTADCWERCHDLTFQLELNRAECEFLTGALAEADERLTALATRDATPVEYAAVTCLRIDLYTTLDQSNRAVDVGLDFLRHLGSDWSAHPTDDEVCCEYERIWAQLGSRTIEELIDLPLMTDPACLATLDVVAKLAPLVFFTDANLHCLLISWAVNLSLERGNSDGSCEAYVRLGMIAGERFEDYQTGYRFGQLGYKLVEQHNLKRFEARTVMLFGAHVIVWTRHFRAGRDLLRNALEIANKTGDVSIAGYNRNNMMTNLLIAGDSLDEVQREAERSLAFAHQSRFGLCIDIISTQLALVQTLRGLTQAFGIFDDAQFEEHRIELRFASNSRLAMAECWYWTRKLQARFLAGEYAAALDAASRIQPLLWTSRGLLETAEYHFYGALSHAACCDAMAADQRAPHVEALNDHYRQLQVWAANCPENFENRAALVHAEIARIEGRTLDAEHSYEKAIRSARDNGFVHNEAIAHELAARFYLAHDLPTAGHAHLDLARDRYAQWGADGKVRQLEQQYPQLRMRAGLATAAHHEAEIDNAQLYADVRDSHARIRRLVESSIIGIFFWDLSGNITEANNAFLEMVGYSQQDLLAGEVNWERMTPPEYRALDERKAVEVRETRTCTPYEKEFLRKDGSRIPVLIGAVLFDDSPDHGVAFVLDLFERKRAEAEREARHAAEAANRAKSAFLANMSHELRTPLNSILGYTQILLRDQALSGRQLTGLNVIQRSGEYLLTLINDILDLIKIEAGKMELYLVDIPLARFVQVITEVVGVKAAQKGLELVCDLASDLPQWIRADEKRLCKVLHNLLSNAVKFTDSGRVALRVRLVQPTRLGFEVQDTGIGIAADQLESIFEPFGQAGDMRRRLSGTGLGLAISRQYVRVMGGDIQVESQPGQGSTFRFEVQVQPVQAAMPVTSSKTVTGYAGPRKKVLVVDDVAENRTVVTDLLTPLGFEVAEAANGREGLEMAQRLRPDLILMDIVMPELDGLAATRLLRQREAFREVPVLAMSASVSANDSEQSLAAGMNAFLPKPIDTDKLLEQMARLLQLEWTYGPAKAEAPPEAGPIVVPPAEEMEVLHQLAKLGNMRAIVAQADHLSKLDERYRPFANQLSSLAKDYQSKAVLRLVEEHRVGESKFSTT